MVALSGPGWRLAPSLVAYVREADSFFAARDHSSDGSIGDLAHASRESDHNPYEGFVHAVDLDEDVAKGKTLLPMWHYLIAVRDPRIRYLIYEGRIVKSYRDSAGHRPWVPYPYTGPNAHEHHMHLSINRTTEARMDVHRWGFAKAYPTAPPPITEDDDMTPEQAKWLQAVELRSQSTEQRLSRLELQARATLDTVARIEKAIAAQGGS